jgi:NADPH-dependent curcumin reductase CurA
MQNVMNRRWLLGNYPEGMPTPDRWTMDKQPVPDPGAGQILVKAKWLFSNYARTTHNAAKIASARLGPRERAGRRLAARFRTTRC